jgi:acetolactate synthase I/II/III large subunit
VKEQGTRLYEALAEAFAAEDVTEHFTLLGDGNMHWASRLAELGARTFYVRHEHCACAMAMSYANATAKVGVASVTCGPGLTQIMTALTTAVRAEIPLVIFAGESPLGSAWYNQWLEQLPFVQACGAHYVAIHNPDLALSKVAGAFLHARLRRQPVVLGVPMDLQQKPFTKTAYLPSAILAPAVEPVRPGPQAVERAAEVVGAAERIVIVAGRGAVRSGARDACVELAELCGAYLATTLPARGLFHDYPFDLGVTGGFSADAAREVFADADLVIAVGARLAHHTVDGGKLFPSAHVLQVDTNPTGYQQGRKAADSYLMADAKAGIGALVESLRGSVRGREGWRDPGVSRRVRSEWPDKEAFAVEDGSLDPRAVIAELDRVLPKGWEMVNGSGHSSYYSAHMHGRSVEHFHTIREFGAIGNGLSYGMGVAAARPDNVVVVIDGDGGVLMHAQELETIRRHKLRMLVCVLNDGAYGSEIHKLRADRLDESGAVFGRGDIGAVARGFGLGGQVIGRLEDFGKALEAFVSSDRATLWDIPISANVVSPVMRKAHPKKH